MSIRIIDQNGGPLAQHRVRRAAIAFMMCEKARLVAQITRQMTTSETKRLHDLADSQADVEDLFRAVMRLGDTQGRGMEFSDMIDRHRTAADGDSPIGPSIAPPERADQVLVRERNGIWHVTVAGEFRGDYHRKEHAVDAAELLRSSQ